MLMTGKKVLGVIVSCLTIGMLLCSCILNSRYPLTDRNNCSIPELPGTWILMDKDQNGVTVKGKLEIREAGEKYTYQENDGKGYFILTKLGKDYFASVSTAAGLFNIVKIQLENGILTVLGFDRKTMELTKNELYEEHPELKVRAKLSQQELQEWCLRNTDKFSTAIHRYQRAKRKNPAAEYAAGTNSSSNQKDFRH